MLLSTPGSPEVGVAGVAPVEEDNEEEAEDIDGKGDQEGVDAQELDSEVPNGQTEAKQTSKEVPLNTWSHFSHHMMSFTFQTVFSM